MWGVLLSFLEGINLSPVTPLASLLKTDVAALKILISLFMGYAIAIFYDKHIRKISNNEKLARNLFFILSGLDIAYFNFGWTLIYNVIPVLFVFLTYKILGPGKYNCTISCAFNVLYLLAGYLYTESEVYDITWTMPHCVLTLKLFAFSFDLWDGQKMKNKVALSQNQIKTAIIEGPTLLELFGFVYFPACFLVGPIFSYKRYIDFVSNLYPLDDEVSVYERVEQSFKKMGLAVAYLLMYQVGSLVFTSDYMLTEEFRGTSIFYRHIYCGIWAQVILRKYISCWLLTEGCCILFGISYNGTNKDKHQWDGCTNIKVYRFETATKFQHYIDSFNCNTNYFAMEYLYKRLKFLNNRYISQIVTLTFLALWHGTFSGYYITFLNEFLIIFMEKEFEQIIKKTIVYDMYCANPRYSYILNPILKLYAIVFMGWSLVPFDLKMFSKWFVVYKALWFSGFVLFLPWGFLYKPLLLNLVKKIKSSSTVNQE